MSKANKLFILYKFASRSRPEKCIDAINNIHDLSADKDNYLILITADEDDETMYNKNFLRKIKQSMEVGVRVAIRFGKSKSKIDAINRDMQDYQDWDILVNWSDDMLWTEKGFDEFLRQKMQLHYSDTDGVLHLNDGFTQDKVCTMSVMGKKFYNRFGYIYHPAYKSLWCDNEFTEVAIKLNKLQYFHEVLYNHNHPANIGGLVDMQLMKTQADWGEDYKVYESRKKNNFDL